MQLVNEAAAGPSQDEEARQASAQELQSVKDALNQAETRTKELEGQLENINKVRHHKYQQFKTENTACDLLLNKPVCFTSFKTVKFYFHDGFYL